MKTRQPGGCFFGHAKNNQIRSQQIGDKNKPTLEWSRFVFVEVSLFQCIPQVPQLPPAHPPQPPPAPDTARVVPPSPLLKAAKSDIARDVCIPSQFLH
jgi:hypothetical protein